MSIVLPVSMQEAKESGSQFFIEMYILELRTGIAHICACDENITFNGTEYMAVPFQRAEINKSMDNIVDSCEISLGDCTEEILKFIMDGYDFRGTSATVFRIQYPESLSNPQIYEWMFSGTLDEPSYSDGVFTCKIKSRFPEINCPNRSFQLACNSEFGDECCGLSTRETADIIVSVNNNVLTLENSYSKDFWLDGVATVNGESRIIIASSGNTVTLNVNFLQDNLQGKQVNLQRGCNKTVERCKKYNNLKNYGGFPAVPFESNYR